VPPFVHTNFAEPQADASVMPSGRSFGEWFEENRKLSREALGQPCLPPTHHNKRKSAVLRAQRGQHRFIEGQFLD
jgi:hypothetical protein